MKNLPVSPVSAACSRCAVLLALSGLLLLPLAGCSDLLEPEVFGDLTPETFFSSEADFRTAVAALYNPFMTDWGTNDQGAGVWYAALYNHDPKTYLIRSMTPTDELFSPWSTTFDFFEWGPTTFNGGNGPTYAKIRYVARATDVIDKIQKSDAPVPPEVKARYIAEAKALRGWLMYILYDFFGPVNVKLDPATLHDPTITPRPSKEEYVAAIEQDLLEALPDLPDRYNGDAANWGRVSKGAVRMVLLRLYMHEKQWAKAEQVARDIMAMGYSLMPYYPDVFNVEQNNEIIYAVPANEASQNYWPQEIIPPNFASTTLPSGKTITRGPGWYGFWMPWEFYDLFEPGDERLHTIADSYVTTSGAVRDRTSGMRGAIPLKFTDIQGDGPGYGFDMPVFRYAETLLSLAEAINEQRGPDEAYEYVNQVRARAGLAPWSGMTQAQFREAILQERGRELYAEGVRRQDLIRHGKFIEYAPAGASAGPHHVLFPIPQEVIDQGGGVIEQNPGY
ncbi:MAG: membrane protein [Rhodothermaceae bacterium]|nr:MAG: membrane protein [Rhodothermaceae bacterium]